MAGRQKKNASAMQDAGLFDPRGTVAFPPRVAVLGSVHGSQIFGLAHAGFAERVQIVPRSQRGLQGFTTHLPNSQPVFIVPRTTSMLANTSATVDRPRA